MSIPRSIGIQRLPNPTPPPARPAIPSLIARILARLESDLRMAEEARDQANRRWLAATVATAEETRDRRKVIYYQCAATCERIAHDINLIQEEVAR